MRICANVAEDRLDAGNLCRGPIAYIERAELIDAFMDYVNGSHNVLKLYRKSLQELGAQMLRDVIIACSTLIFEKL